MSNSTAPITIKKYANRRLYNTASSAYVTLADLAKMVKTGEDFVVYDAKTNEDITRSVLAQIIFEQEGIEGQSLLPITFLRQLIRFYGDSVQALLPSYLEYSIDQFTGEKQAMREAATRAFGQGPFSAASFSALQEMTRKNLAAFTQALGLFSPFAGGAAPPNGEPEKAEAPAAKRRHRRIEDAADGDAAPSRQPDRKELTRSAGRAQAAAQRQSGRGGARLVDFRAADEVALEIVDVPFAEQPARFGVLDPFRDRLDAEMARELGEGAHEEAIVERARDVLHEGAVDLDDVDAEAAQIAERGVSGAEIVHRDRRRPSAFMRPSTRSISSIGSIASVSTISTISRSARSRTGRERRLQRSSQSGGAQGGDGDVDGDAQIGFGGEAIERQLEHALIELSDQPDFFRDRKQTSRADEVAVVLPDAQQRFVRTRAPVALVATTGW